MTDYAKMYADAQKDKSVKKLTPKYMKWEKAGQKVIGAFVSKSVIGSRLNDKEYNQYLFDTDEGLVKFALGGVADAEMSAILVPGVVFCITYLGKTDLEGGKRVNKFDFEELGGEPSGGGVNTTPASNG